MSEAATNTSDAVAGRFAALGPWLAEALGAQRVEITGMSKLAGGAIQENWSLDAICEGGSRPGPQAWVLRTDAPSTIATSLPRAEEYAILKVAHAAGVAAPEPIALCEEESLIGGAFYVMARGKGTAHARKIVRDPALPQFGAALAEELGETLARLHAVTPPVADLAFLPVPEGSPVLHRIAQYRADLDALPGGHPVLEYALNWLEDNAPPPQGPVLCHTDFRTGNYMVDGGHLSAVLDWEFASWNDPDEDIGWLTARCWRFGNDGCEVGGVAGLDPFLAGYERVAGRKVARAILPYWQVMAELRWAIIALQQGERCNSGTEITLELALTGVMPPEMELNILNLIDMIEEPQP
ncbi:phosphotransferase family protein [Rhodobacteraceae bacterium DSL-40]|uniref:phosphotransferase family protein n=1 Tax=Amaricoccus sp. B4 TaxID=3368557 RepID=UPI000DADEBD7